MQQIQVRSLSGIADINNKYVLSALTASSFIELLVNLKKTFTPFKTNKQIYLFVYSKPPKIKRNTKKFKREKKKQILTFQEWLEVTLCFFMWWIA